MKVSRYISGMILCLLLATMAPAAVADDEVDAILGLLADAGMVDPALKDAAGLIRCLASGSSNCVDSQTIADDLQSEAVSEAEKQAAKFLPDDPMVKSVVEIVRAARGEDWLRVLELTGVDLLGKIACKSGLAVTGPLQPFICGKFAHIVLDNVKPVVREILVVVDDFPNVDVWDLVSLLGFDLACEIVKDSGVPLSDEACGVIGAAVKAIKDLAEALIGGVGDLLAAVGDLLNSGSGHSLTPQEYYAYQIRPLMYRRALERIVSQRQDLGLNQAERDQCNLSLGYLNPGMGHMGGSPCDSDLSQRLQAEAEALVKLVVAMPEMYVRGFLQEVIRERAVSRYGQAKDIHNYVSKLARSDWDYLMTQGGVSLMAAYTGIDDSDKAFFGQLFRNCTSWANGRLTGHSYVGAPVFEDLQPASLATWVCYEGAAKGLLAALQSEEKRLAAIRSGLNSLGCPSIPATRFEFECQSHISFAICINQSYRDYGKNRYCRAHKENTAKSMGISLINALGEKRCQYIPFSKGNYGDFDPRVQCTRPWKQQTCNALLTKFRAAFEVPSSRIRMRCSYQPDPNFVAEQERAEEVLAALNGGATENVRGRGRQALQEFTNPSRCNSLWDPLAINCPYRTSLPELPSDIVSPPIGPCRADPNKNGSDAVCYQTLFTAKDSAEELVATTPLDVAGPNACTLDVSFYVPEVPVVRTSGSRLQAADQIEISCQFRKETRTLEWSECDDAARTALAVLAASQRSTGRYSGIISIDGNNVGVTSSPEDGAAFTSRHLWSFQEPGAHEIRCNIDNPLSHAVPGLPYYLDNGASLSVGTRAVGRVFERFDVDAARVAEAIAIASQPLPQMPNAVLRLHDVSPDRSFDPTTRYLAVPLQEGPVQSDSDRNETPENDDNE